ncbi:MAG: hypothetical protein GKR90_23170 [Pseudomonadales bacterium]|nr:hypothetical protein [Pseudomonadales bacterium]
MSEPTDLDKFRKSHRKKRGQETTMCGRGFHKWEDEPRKQFDVKQGRLISEEVCKRCGKRRTRRS